MSERKGKIFCDYCGKELTKRTEGDFLILVKCNGDVCFEDGLGDMCRRCAEKLKTLVTDTMRVGFIPERYDSPEDKSFNRMMLCDTMKNVFYE